MLAKAAKYRPAKYKKVSPTTSPLTVSVSGDTFRKKNRSIFSSGCLMKKMLCVKNALTSENAQQFESISKHKSKKKEHFQLNEKSDIVKT